MDLFVIIWFILFFCLLAKHVVQFIENENSPVVTVPAVIADMRRKTHHHSNHISHTYHVTFETENGERLELKVKRYDYKEFSIGDKGILTHQGTRFQGFAR